MATYLRCDTVTMSPNQIIIVTTIIMIKGIYHNCVTVVLQFSLLLNLCYITSARPPSDQAEFNLHDFYKFRLYLKLSYITWWFRHPRHNIITFCDNPIVLYLAMQLSGIIHDFKRIITFVQKNVYFSTFIHLFHLYSVQMSHDDIPSVENILKFWLCFSA